MQKTLPVDFLSEGELIELSELFSIDYDDNSLPAYELWIFLGKPQGEFNKWIKRYLHNEGYGFIPGIDYFTVDQKNRDLGKIIKKSNGRPRRNFQITIDCAKELCILARTRKGKQLCRYFIYVEKNHNRTDQAIKFHQQDSHLDYDKDAFEELDKFIQRLENIQQLDHELRKMAILYAQRLQII